MFQFLLQIVKCTDGSIKLHRNLDYFTKILETAEYLLAPATVRSLEVNYVCESTMGKNPENLYHCDFTVNSLIPRLMR